MCQMWNFLELFFTGYLSPSSSSFYASLVDYEHEIHSMFWRWELCIEFWERRPFRAFLSLIKLKQTSHILMIPCNILSLRIECNGMPFSPISHRKKELTYPLIYWMLLICLNSHYVATVSSSFGLTQYWNPYAFFLRVFFLLSKKIGKCYGKRRHLASDKPTDNA